MKNEETGEFELVLGNRQLLSGFFIVVVLFAVFFVMGYIVGRNSAPMQPQVASREAANTVATAAGARPQAASGNTPAPQTTPPAATPKTETAGGTASQSQPAPETAVESGVKPETPAAPPATPAAPVATPAAPVAAPAETAAKPAEPAEGETYLQVASVKEEVAETVVRTLRDKGFPATTSPGPPGRTRVLVGPYTDLAKLGQAKAELERLGFAPFVKR